MKNIYQPLASVTDSQTDSQTCSHQPRQHERTPCPLPCCLQFTVHTGQRTRYVHSTHRVPLSPVLWFLSLSEDSNLALLPQHANLVMRKVRQSPTAKEPACVARVNINSHCSKPLNLLDYAQWKWSCPVCSLSWPGPKTTLRVGLWICWRSLERLWCTGMTTQPALAAASHRGTRKGQ